MTAIPAVATTATTATTSKTRAQSGEFELLFNNDPETRFREPYRGIEREGHDFEARVVEFAKGARRSVLVAVQELRLPRLARALAEVKASGVDVRVVLENSYNVAFSTLTPEQVAALSEYDRGKYAEFLLLADAEGNRDGQASPEEQRASDALAALKRGGISVLDDTADGSRGSGLMHHKFVVVDGQRTLVTSANFSTSDFFGDFASPESRGNSNALLVIESPDFAALFEEEFRILWGTGRPGGSLFGVQKPYRPARTLRIGRDLTVTVQFSPQSRRIPWEGTSNGLIARTLEGARSTVDFALFVFSEQKLADAMSATGLNVRGLVEPSFAYRDYSEMLDLMGVALLNKNCRYEEGNRPWSRPAPVGIPLLPEGDKLHHKFAVIDREQVLFGSHNWSAAANTDNDETLLLLDGSGVAGPFTDEFERLMHPSLLGPQPWLFEKIRAQEAACARGSN
jgi:phosphatidylserine/phosphatidylglycerophosphate/cardiolipin synthase-like enzyme